MLGYPETWKYELPAVSNKLDTTSGGVSSQPDEKMKIAWRYESLSNRNAPSMTIKGECKSPPIIL